jgi:hypothetical protein
MKHLKGYNEDFMNRYGADAYSSKPGFKDTSKQDKLKKIVDDFVEEYLYDYKVDINSNDIVIYTDNTPPKEIQNDPYIIKDMEEAADKLVKILSNNSFDYEIEDVSVTGITLNKI